MKAKWDTRLTVPKYLDKTFGLFYDIQAYVGLPIIGVIFTSVLSDNQHSMNFFVTVISDKTWFGPLFDFGLGLCGGSMIVWTAVVFTVFTKNKKTVLTKDFWLRNPRRNKGEVKP